MKKLALLILTIIMPIIGFSQEKSSPRQFFDNLKKHEGKAYEGTVTTAPREGFSDKRLVMHMRTISVYHSLLVKIGQELGY